MRNLMAMLLAVLTCWAASPASADPPPATDWHAAARLDLEAAYHLVKDNHPGAVPALGDTAFMARLEASYARASAMADKVTSYAGYAATLRAFMNGLGDKHLWWRPDNPPPGRYQWPGLMVARRGGGWTVVRQEAAAGEPALTGARLVSCDGEDADSLGERRVGGYRAVWSIEAQRIEYGPFLLIDDGNPFLTRPQACVFATAAGPVSLPLAWRDIARDDLRADIGQAVKTGAAGFGVRQFGDATAGGWWIGIQTLDDRTNAVIEAVKTNLTAIRAAPIVVVDLRGNGGGASVFGRKLISVLLGDSAARALNNDGSDCDAYWRATPGNLEGVSAFKRDKAPAMGGNWVAELGRLEGQMKAAMAKGQPFHQPLKACHAAAAGGPQIIGKLGALKGRLVLLTDHACFSSCLLVADDFRRLGALHVGEATDAATRYMEVREIRLPSGLSFASTLQKAAIGAPAQIGPYVPSRLFDGDISDSAALEAWVAATVKGP
jgi:hypothetical protein